MAAEPIPAPAQNQKQIVAEVLTDVDPAGDEWATSKDFLQVQSANLPQIFWHVHAPMSDIIGMRWEMLGFKSLEVIQEELIGPNPHPVEIMQREPIIAEYNTLAAKLGVVCRAGGTERRMRLLNVLAENMIQVYDLSAVERYMDNKGENWGWSPLRSADHTGDKTVWILERATPGSKHGYGESRNQLYAKEVPLPVLETVDKIVGLFGEKEAADLIFMVGALTTEPDPFLGVRFKSDLNRTLIVIERWDEPTFRG